MDVRLQGGKLGCRRLVGRKIHAAIKVSSDGSLPRVCRKWSDSGSLLKAEVS